MKLKELVEMVKAQEEEMKKACKERNDEKFLEIFNAWKSEYDELEIRRPNSVPKREFSAPTLYFENLNTLEEQRDFLFMLDKNTSMRPFLKIDSDGEAGDIEDILTSLIKNFPVKVQTDKDTCVIDKDHQIKDDGYFIMGIYFSNDNSSSKIRARSLIRKAKELESSLKA